MDIKNFLSLFVFGAAVAAVLGSTPRYPAFPALDAQTVQTDVDLRLTATADIVRVELPTKYAASKDLTTYVCVQWASVDDPSYAPLKCQDLDIDQLAVVEDWSFINCTMGGPAYCPDNKDWDVRAFVQTAPAKGGQYSDAVYSNTVRVRFVDMQRKQA